MKQPIAIIFANLKGNLGDFAILHASMVQIADIFPGHPIHVYPHDMHVIDKERLEAFRRESVPSFELKDWVYSRPMPAGLKKFRNFGLGKYMQAKFISQMTNEAKKDANKFEFYRAIFVSGGAQWGGNIGSAMFAGVNAISEYNKNIYTFPFSIESKVSEINTMSNLLNYFSKIQNPLFVRDSKSENFINRIGVNALDVGDCVLSLKSNACHISALPNVNKERIILTLTKDEKKLYKILNVIIPKLLNNFQVDLLSTCDVIDGGFCEKISSEFSIAYFAPLTWQETVSHYKSCALLITNRLHGVVFGLLAEVPILPVLNRGKTMKIANDINFLHKANTFDELNIDVIRNANYDREDILSRMNAYKNARNGKIFINQHISRN